MNTESLIVAAALVLAGSADALAQAPRDRAGQIASDALGWYPYGEKYDNWQKSRPFMLGGVHNSVPRDHLVERMERFKAAGLNTVLWWKPANAMHVFETAHKVGLQWACGYVGGPAAIEPAMRIPGCAFVLAGDEPSRPEELPKIAEAADWVRKTYPEVLVFANLSITKIDHDSYIEQCKPDLFSFDHYPLRRDGEEHGHYLYNVNWGRSTARKYRLPYWMFLQAFGREEPKPSYAYRIPDEADMRYLVFSFLGHGGTGILLFTYYGYNQECMIGDLGVPDPGRMASDKQNYENTVMTRSWFAVRDLAPEVQNLARALVNLRTEGEVGYAGTIPEKCKPFEGDERLHSATCVENPQDPVMIGWFVDRKGEEYFMIVNLVYGKNLSKMDGRRTIRLVLSDRVESIERLNRHTGLVETLSTRRTEGGKRTLDVHLGGGTGDLLKWSTGNAWTLREQQ